MARSALDGLSSNLSDVNQAVSQITDFFEGDPKYRYEYLMQNQDAIAKKIRDLIRELGITVKQEASFVLNSVMCNLLHLNGPEIQEGLVVLEQ